jgi:hypothetical protein
LAFYGDGVTASESVRTDTPTSFNANLNDTGLDVDLAFVGLESYDYASGTAFTATFSEEGPASFTIIATDGCSIAMDTVTVDVDNDDPVSIGSFRLADAPSYYGGPPTYTCLEACALLFGGSSSDYQCSTDSVSIDNMSVHSKYGVGGCHVEPEDYKLGTTYSSSGHSSAYVADNCTSVDSDTNYCFAI